MKTLTTTASISGKISIERKVKQLAVELDQLNVMMRTTFTSLCGSESSATCDQALKKYLIDKKSELTIVYADNRYKIMKLARETQRAEAEPTQTPTPVAVAAAPTATPNITAPATEVPTPISTPRTAAISEKKLLAEYDKAILETRAATTKIKGLSVRGNE
jgi:hypothetical protein